MATTPRQLIKLVVFTTGRRIYALRKVRATALALSLTDLVAHIDAAIAHDRTTLTLEARWRGRRVYGRRHAPETTDIDNRLDQLLTGVRNTLMTFIQALSQGDPRREAAERFVDGVFPQGVYPITSLPFIDQLAAIEDLLDRIAADFSAEVALLSISHLIALIAEVTDEYREALDQGPSRLDYATVKAAQDRGQDFLLAIVAMALGAFYRIDDPAHNDAREALLAPIMDQQEAIREYLRARRPVEDVDPDGDGEPIPAPEPEPMPEPEPWPGEYAQPTA